MNADVPWCSMVSSQKGSPAPAVPPPRGASQEEPIAETTLAIEPSNAPRRMGEKKRIVKSECGEFGCRKKLANREPLYRRETDCSEPMSEHVPLLPRYGGGKSTRNNHSTKNQVL